MLRLDFRMWRTFSHLVEHSFDVDGQVTVRAAKPSYDAEAQARGASLQSDGLIHTSTAGTEWKTNLEGSWAYYVHAAKIKSSTSSVRRQALCLCEMCVSVTAASHLTSTYSTLG